MGVSATSLSEWLAGYNSDEITIGVVASHSSLQILHGAKKEGFKTLGTVSYTHLTLPTNREV